LKVRRSERCSGFRGVGGLLFGVANRRLLGGQRAQLLCGLLIEQSLLVDVVLARPETWADRPSPLRS